MPSYEVEIRLLILQPGKLRRERWIICWRLLRSAGLEVVPCLVSLLPETTNTFKAWLWSCNRKCVVVPGVFAERGWKSQHILGVGPLEEGALLGRPRSWGENKEGHTGPGRFFLPGRNRDRDQECMVGRKVRWSVSRRAPPCLHEKFARHVIRENSSDRPEQSCKGQSMQHGVQDGWVRVWSCSRKCFDEFYLPQVWKIF